MTQARRTGPALETMYRFLLWLVPAVEKFPRGPYPDRLCSYTISALQGHASSRFLPSDLSTFVAAASYAARRCRPEKSVGRINGASSDIP